MPAIDITIVRHDSPPPWERIKKIDIIEADKDTWYVAVLEGGMQSGEPSVMLRLMIEQSDAVIGETSLAAWIAATCAMRGAFPEAFAGTPLAVTE